MKFVYPCYHQDTQVTTALCLGECFLYWLIPRLKSIRATPRIMQIEVGDFRSFCPSYAEDGCHKFPCEQTWAGSSPALSMDNTTPAGHTFGITLFGLVNLNLAEHGLRNSNIYLAFSHLALRTISLFKAGLQHGITFLA